MSRCPLVRPAGRATRLALVALVGLLGCAGSSAPAGPGAVPAARHESTPAPAVTSRPESALVVGAYLSFTGQEAAFGHETRQGIDLAIDAANAAGGARGRRIEVRYRDDASSPRAAADAVVSFVEQDDVRALLGEVASSRSKAGGIVAQRVGVPMIATGSTNPDVTRVGEFVFRACGTDDQQGAAAARFAASAGRRRIGLLTSPKDLYSVALARSFKQQLERMGLSLAVEATIEAGRDPTAAIDALRGASPDVVFAPLYYTDMIPFARAAAARGLPGRVFLGGDGWDTQNLLDEAGDVLEGAAMTNHFAVDAPWPAARRFVAAFQQRFGSKPGSLGALGHDAALVLVDAIRRAADDTPGAIRDALVSTSGLEGATGTFVRFDADRNPVKPFVVVRIHARRFEYAAEVEGAAR